MTGDGGTHVHSQCGLAIVLFLPGIDRLSRMSRIRGKKPAFLSDNYLSASGITSSITFVSPGETPTISCTLLSLQRR